jgi:phosphonopyruvate decarboxylase
MEDTEYGLQGQLDTAFRAMKTGGTPFALIVRKDTFAPYKAAADGGGLSMTREAAIEEIMLSSPDSLFFSTTGMASRELYELREKHGLGHYRDFLTVGSMGHASSLALGAALARPDALITCLDGDGAALMHLGALATIGTLKPRNLRHIVLNNGAHDSVGGQPTAALGIELTEIDRAAGYERVLRVDTMEDLRLALRGGHEKCLTFIEARVKRGARADLGRPKTSPAENKAAFVRQLHDIAPKTG